MRDIVRRASLPLLLAVAAAARLAYVAAQPLHDPDFSRPMLDGAYYVEWARGLAAGSGSPAGAFYLAPLYPVLLSLLFRAFGESFALLYSIQHFATLAAAALLAGAARRAAGAGAGLATAAVFLLYHPVLFFASRPMGEALALALLAAALRLRVEEGPVPAGLAGLAGGLAALARPNLLLVPVAWAVLDAAGRRYRDALILLAGLAAAILPVTVRNLAASGHPVLISSNSGMTLYHGNAPGAEGILRPPQGFTGSVERQREEATRIARQRTGLPLDAVEADRYWGREAVGARIADPLGTLALLGRKVLLILDDTELGLDYATELDENPWRRAAPLPFAILAGLAATGLVLAGVPRTGGAPVWSAILAAALAPVAFFVSSRYRLPLAALLAIPAGSGAAALLSRRHGASPRRRFGALAAGAAVAVGSFLVPSAGLERAGLSAALANRSAGHLAARDYAAAERDARRSLEIEPRGTLARFNLGVTLEAAGRPAEAERIYREALDVDPSNPDVAGNLAGLLIGQRRDREAIPILRRALDAYPDHPVCLTNLVVALAASGDLPGARRAAKAALAAGVRLDAGMLRALGL